MNKMNFRGISFDAVLLTFVRLLTTILGIFSTMLLSKSLSLSVYGTYAQANLVISIGTSFSILGLSDGINFFFNKAQNDIEGQKSVNTIFSVQMLIGTSVGICILIFSDIIIRYFQNENLAGLFIYIAFRPLLNNLLAMLQNLQVSIGKTKVIAGRNVIVAGIKLVAIYLAVNVFNDIRTIFLILLVLDGLIVLYFGISFSKEKYTINFFDIKVRLIPQILKFCIPMGLFVLTNSLSRDIDKFCIGRLGGTEELAIYTNCSVILPVDIISTAFLTVIIPVMTRYIASGDYARGSDLFSYYIQIGYLTTATFSVAIITLSSEVILFLYGEQYLAGKTVFLLYMVVTIFRFANLSLVLSAKGETSRLMGISIVGLIANTFMNIAFYRLMGFVGPAVATVVITGTTVLIMLKRSIEILHTNWNKVFNFKKLAVYILELFIISFAFRQVANYLRSLSISIIGTILIAGGGICGIVFLLNYKMLFSLLKQVNQLK